MADTVSERELIARVVFPLAQISPLWDSSYLLPSRIVLGQYFQKRLEKGFRSSVVEICSFRAFVWMCEFGRFQEETNACNIVRANLLSLFVQREVRP
jgi:hypothetical protein